HLESRRQRFLPRGPPRNHEWRQAGTDSGGSAPAGILPRGRPQCLPRLGARKNEDTLHSRQESRIANSKIRTDSPQSTRRNTEKAFLCASLRPLRFFDFEFQISKFELVLPDVLR